MTYPAGHRDKSIQVQGNINNYPASGYYSRVFFNQTTVPPTPLGTCANVNCHFESATYSWGSAGFVSPGDCTQCHAVAPASGNHPVAGSKHGNYYGTGTGACRKCHPDHAGETKSFAHATSAANRGIAVRFTIAPNSGGTYSGDGLNFLPSENKTTFVVSECPLAREHIIQGMKRVNGGETEVVVEPVQHPIQLVARAYAP